MTGFIKVALMFCSLSQGNYYCKLSDRRLHINSNHVDQMENLYFREKGNEDQTYGDWGCAIRLDDGKEIYSSWKCEE